MNFLLKNKNSAGIRVDGNFEKTLRELAKIRYIKNLAKKEPSMAEMSRLLMRTNGWNISLEELKIKPKKNE